MQIRLPAALSLLGSLLLLFTGGLAGCSGLSSERLVYDRDGARIGLEPDPTISRADTPVANSHPARLSAAELRTLLQAIQISGWSGTVTGLLGTPRPVSLLTSAQLTMLSETVAAALQTATPAERVLFSLPKPGAAYSEDRTTGALFLRGRYLHLIVTDHSAFLQADTAGADLRDLRDSKGMTLWIAPPAQAATVPDREEPRWAPFETVHVSLHVAETLARQAAPPVARTPQTEPMPPLKKDEHPRISTEDLQLQIRELTTSNQELRSRLEDQTARMEQLNQHIEQLRRELDAAKSKTARPKRAPAP